MIFVCSKTEEGAVVITETDLQVMKLSLIMVYVQKIFFSLNSH